MSSSLIQKFCHACGRIISRAKSTDTNFLNQKYCSNSCRLQKPSAFDRSIESAFLTRLHSSDGSTLSSVSRRDGIKCTAIEALVFADSSKEGMQKAKDERERVRRAARRIVVFPDSDTVVQHGGAGKRYECVQNGKAVDPSFAKNDFGVRVSEWP